MVRNTGKAIGVAVALAILSGCGSAGEAAAKNGASGDSPRASGTNGDSTRTGGGSSGERGGGGGSGTRGGGPGGRGALSVVLGPNDVALVKRGLIESAISIQGDLKPIEEIAIRARIEGNVDAVYVREGDRVGRGQVIARFENSNQESARKSADADLESAKADVVNAQWNADQSAELFKAGAIPERDLRSAQQTLVAAKARQAAAEAKVRATSQDLEDTRVLSPTNGVISARSVENGEHVSRGATVFTVVRNDVLELEASVPARYASDVKAALPVRFDAGGRSLNGRVARVSPNINPANRALTVYLQVTNPEGILKGNTFATGRIIARSVPDAIVVPTGAIRYTQTQAKPLVYRIVNQAIEFATVDLGIVDEVAGTAQVVDGLSEGDRIVVGNIGALGRGVKVVIAGAPERGRSRDFQGGGGRSGDSTSRGKRSDNPVPRPPND